MGEPRRHWWQDGWASPETACPRVVVCCRCVMRGARVSQRPGERVSGANALVGPGGMLPEAVKLRSQPWDTRWICRCSAESGPACPPARRAAGPPASHVFLSGLPRIPRHYTTWLGQPLLDCTIVEVGSLRVSTGWQAIAAEWWQQELYQHLAHSTCATRHALATLEQ